VSDADVQITLNPLGPTSFTCSITAELFIKCWYQWHTSSKVKSITPVKSVGGVLISLT